MGLRVGLLRALYASPRIRGRDRLIGTLTESFSPRPKLLLTGIKMLLDPAEWVQQEILIKGSTEPVTLDLLRKLSTAGSTIVDVGAHVGHHSLEAAKAVGASGRVIAFDPQPYNADRIGRHAVLNGFAHMLTICAAVGDHDAFVMFPLQSDRDRARLSLHEAGPGDRAAFVEVPLRRLDTVFAAHDISQVELLKIDVEGYELEVLRGLGTRIGDCRNIILEMLDATEAPRSREIVDLLAGAGFVFKDVAGRPWQWGRPLVESNLWAARH